MLKKMLLLDFEDTKGFVWKDVRVTKKFFRTAMTRQRHRSAEDIITIFNTWQEIFRGFFGDQTFSKIVTGDLCF